MARQTAVSTQLKQAQARIAELSKELESSKQSWKWATDSRDEAQRELEQTHAIIDVLSGALPREKKDYGHHTAAVRIASWLAAKQ